MRTYQSKKYQATTAKSDVVKVELVKEMTFDVVQNSTTKFTVYFNNPVKSLTVKDVEVIRNLETTAGVYPYPQTLKKVELAKDKMSATVEIFQTMMHETNYTIKVKDHEDYVLTASNGKPVRMELKAKDMNPGIIVYTGVATEIQYTLYDAKNVQVALADGEKVRLTLDRANSSKEVSFSGSNLTIRKNTASATVTATYQGYKENGKFVGDFTTSEVFFAEDAPEVVPVSVHRYGLDTAGWSDWNLKSFQIQNNPKLHAQIADSKNGNDWGTDYVSGTVFKGNPNGNKNKVVFEAMNPEICVINNAGVLTGIKPGVATFYVNYVYVDANKKEQSYPFDEITIEVLANSYVDYVTMSEGSKTVGTAEGYNTADLFVLGRDQYNNRTNIASVSKVSIKTLTEFEDDVKTDLANALKSNVAMQDAYWNDGSGKNAAKITVKAVTLRDILVDAGEMSTKDNDGECISVDFEVTYDNNKVVEFTVTIQEPSGSAEDNVIDIVANAASKDVMRKWSSWDNNAKAEKTVTFWVNWMNNDVQVGTQTVKKFDAKAAADGDYQVKVLKDGEDVTAKTDIVVSGNSITLKPSYIKAVDARVANVVSGGAVSYDVLGEGVYTLELYKWTAEGDELVESLEGTADVSISVGNAGAYTTDLENLRSNKVKVSAAATGNEYNKTDAKNILMCFKIKNTDGNDLVVDWSNDVQNMGDGKLYFVNYTAVEGTDTVYVKEIVFYEPVATGEYVAYTVAIDKALTWDK
ncbi:MAG: hypothetical protein IJ427_12930 [Lachnospiraceae bacterium]|nr:hypothetical protein [Lachnospiraceae bacterium]